MKKKVNQIVLVVDGSGSMARFAAKVREVFSGLIKDIEGNREQTNHVSVVLFNNSIINVLPSRFSDEYRPSGGTRLLDAVGQAIQQLQERRTSNGRGVLPWEKGTDEAKLVIVLTDGEENESQTWTFSSIASEIKRLQANGDWTFVFQIPPGHRSYITRLGVPVENIREWAPTERAFVETIGATTQGLGSYYSARSSGLKSVSNFYKGTTDLSGISKTDLKSLDNVTSRFRPLNVTKESVIQDFVQEEMGGTYFPGTAYYQLTKPETIQSRKAVLIMEKGKKTILGGDKARDLIGLKPFKDGKITPGNHSDFDIFVQSTSSNRKLVRGTKLLVLK